ncbi:MAG: hypothetical protein NT094_00865 [Candidatus Staskawiczbacteria bacterium]|nr:hypothetical protein [Candidatus Staskawiczbacteria bacterium]
MVLEIIIFIIGAFLLFIASIWGLAIIVFIFGIPGIVIDIIIKLIKKCKNKNL